MGATIQGKARNALYAAGTGGQADTGAGYGGGSAGYEAGGSMIENDRLIEQKADEEFFAFLMRWGDANRLSGGSLGKPSSIEIWHHAFRSGLKYFADSIDKPQTK